MLCGPLSAAAQTPSNQWTFSITPYLWLPNVDGTLKYSVPPGSGGSPEVQSRDRTTISRTLSFAMMISGEVRKDRWSVFTDFIYLDFSDEESTVKSIDFGGSLVNASANVSTRLFVEGRGLDARRGLRGPAGPARGVSMSSAACVTSAWRPRPTGNSRWQFTGPGGGQTFPRTGSISEKRDLWDGIVGVKGRVWLGGSNWSIPYYLDVGTGSSSLTWQGMLGIAYTYKWIGVTLAYRASVLRPEGRRADPGPALQRPGARRDVPLLTTDRTFWTSDLSRTSKPDDIKVVIQFSKILERTQYTKEDSMKQRKEESSEETRGAAVRSRRSILKGSAALLVGGIAGRISNAYAAPEPHSPRRRPCPGSGPSSIPWRPERGPMRTISRTKG